MTAITRAYLDIQLANGSPPTVARRIAAVATARRPKARYVVPASSNVLVGFLGALPDAIADRAKRSALGLSNAVETAIDSFPPADNLTSSSLWGQKPMPLPASSCWSCCRHN